MFVFIIHNRHRVALGLMLQFCGSMSGLLVYSTGFPVKRSPNEWREKKKEKKRRKGRRK